MDNLTTSSNNMSNNTSFLDNKIKLAMYAGLLVVSLVGDILIIAVVSYNENLKTSFNHLIMNMAISDLLVPLIAIPFKLAHYSGLHSTSGWAIGGVPGNFLCKLSYFLADMGASVSLFTLVVIAAGRFVAIVLPLNIGLGNALNKKNKYLIALTWLMAIGMNAPNLNYMKVKKGIDDGTFRCQWTIDGPTMVVLMRFYLACFFIPLLLIAILYSIIMYKLHRKTQDASELIENRLAHSRRKRNRKTFCLSVVIILGCLITLAPLHSFLAVWVLIWNADYTPYITKETFTELHFYFLYLYHCNAAINACIYFIFVKSFRQGLKCLFGGKKPQRSRLNTTSTLVNRTSASRITKTDDEVHMEQIELKE